MRPGFHDGRALLGEVGQARCFHGPQPDPAHGGRGLCGTGEGTQVLIWKAPFDRARNALAQSAMLALSIIRAPRAPRSPVAAAAASAGGELTAMGPIGTGTRRPKWSQKAEARMRGVMGTTHVIIRPAEARRYPAPRDPASAPQRDPSETPTPHDR